MDAERNGRGAPWAYNEMSSARLYYGELLPASRMTKNRRAAALACSRVSEIARVAGRSVDNVKFLDCTPLGELQGRRVVIPVVDARGCKECRLSVRVLSASRCTVAAVIGEVVSEDVLQHGTACSLKSSLESQPLASHVVIAPSDEWLLLPRVWVEARELVACLFYPDHFFLHVNPASVLKL